MLGTGRLGDGLEETQQNSQGAGGQSILDPKLWDFWKVVLGLVDSVPTPGT